MTDLAKHGERIAKDIESRKTVYRIERPGSPGMLLMDWQEWEGWMAVIQLMQRPNWREELEQSEHDFAAGRGRDLEQIVKELALEGATQRPRRAPAGRATAGRRKKSRSRVTRPRGRSA